MAGISSLTRWIIEMDPYYQVPVLAAPDPRASVIELSECIFVWTLSLRGLGNKGPFPQSYESELKFQPFEESVWF